MAGRTELYGMVFDADYLRERLGIHGYGFPDAPDKAQEARTAEQWLRQRVDDICDFARKVMQ